jgi:cell division transport system permease protein
MAKLNLQPGNDSVHSRRLGSYPHRYVIISIAIALSIVGIFSCAARFVHQLAAYMRQNVEVRVFVEHEASPEEVENIRNMLSESRYIARDGSGKPRLYFISRDSIAREFVESTGDDFVVSLGKNPFRDAFAIYMEQEYFSKQLYSDFKEKMELVPGVNSLTNLNVFLENIEGKLRMLIIIPLVAILFLTGLILFLVNNAIKMALFSQRLLIRSMQLVGATDGFIKKPFLIRSLRHGLKGSSIAIGIVLAGNYLAFLLFPAYDLAKDYIFLLVLCGFLLFFGLFICFFSVFLAVNKYLDRPLDELL